MYLVCCLAFWQLYSNAEWGQSFILTGSQISHRVSNALITENMFFGFYMFLNIFSLNTFVNIFLLFFIMYNYKTITFREIIKDRFLLISAMFVMLFMSKYLILIYPLLIFNFIRIYGTNLRNEHPLFNTAIVLFSVAMLTSGVNIISNYQYKDNIIDLPEGSKIFTTFNGLNYIIPYSSKNNIHIFPSMEFGAGEKNNQEQSIKLSSGNVDCEFLKQNKYDLVAENTLSIPPKCLTFFTKYHDINFWKIN